VKLLFTQLEAVKFDSGSNEAHPSLLEQTHKTH